MKLNLYSVHDVKLGVYITPFAARGDVDALRQISSAMKDPQLAGAAMVQTPSDFTLCHVATFDDESGQFDFEVAGPTVLTPLNKLVAKAEKPELEPYQGDVGTVSS